MVWLASGIASSQLVLHEKVHFPGAGISWKARKTSKFYIYINFLAKTRPYFPSPKSSKQELFGSPKQELFSNQ